MIRSMADELAKRRKKSKVRKQTAQLNVRLTPEDDALIRAYIPKGSITVLARQHLVDLAASRRDAGQKPIQQDGATSAA